MALRKNEKELLAKLRSAGAGAAERLLDTFLQAYADRLIGSDQPWEPFAEATSHVWPDGSVHDKPSGADVVYVNNRYQVYATFHENKEFGRFVHLSIKRQDALAVRDWRDLQRIKNEIVGPEAEAVEIFPAEDRLVDMANQFHLWVTIDSRVPFGWEDGRMLSSTDPGGVGRQRPWQEGDAPPDDLKISSEQINAYLLQRGDAENAG